MNIKHILKTSTFATIQQPYSAWIFHLIRMIIICKIHEKVELILHCKITQYSYF